MSTRNRDIVATFNQVADMLAIRGDQIHRVLAYRRAAEAIDALGRDINAVHAEGKLTDIPGIGQTLAAKIAEMLDTGRLEFYERLGQDVPPALVDLLRIEGIGPKRVKLIYDAFGATTIDEVAALAEAKELQQLAGMGPKSEARLLKAIESLARHGDARVLLGAALPVARDILARLDALPGVVRSAYGGSLRRMRESIGDIDLLVAADDAGPIMEAFRNLENAEQVSVSGPTKTRIVLFDGTGVDLRVLPPERWGTLLAYFTGSKDHNVRVRELALRLGYSLNEHALVPLNGDPEILCAAEEEVYGHLGLPYIPPTLRENRGEVEAALAGQLPVLIERDDIICDLHVHSTWSDGKESILAMAQHAQAAGHKYMALTDHSASLGIANGLTVERLHEQVAEVRQAEQEMGGGFRILHGTELEVLADGSLDYPEEVLAELDLVIASVHTGLRQSREKLMTRFANAIRNPHVDIIAHPTGRLLNEREGGDVDMEQLLSLAAEHDTIIEINANPQRLDLNDVYARRALELGVKLAINTDAHHGDHFAFMELGVATAQRGWVTSVDVINTWPLARLENWLRGRSQ